MRDCRAPRAPTLVPRARAPAYPVWIKDDDAVGASEVDTKAADLGGQQKHKDARVAIELLNQPRSHRDRYVAIHAHKPESCPAAPTHSLATAISVPAHQLLWRRSQVRRGGGGGDFTATVDAALHDIQHLARLAKDQRAVALAVPQRQERRQNVQLAGAGRVAVVFARSALRKPGPGVKRA